MYAVALLYIHSFIFVYACEYIYWQISIQHISIYFQIIKCSTWAIQFCACTMYLWMHECISTVYCVFFSHWCVPTNGVYSWFGFAETLHQFPGNSFNYQITWLPPYFTVAFDILKLNEWMNLLKFCIVLILTISNYWQKFSLYIQPCPFKWLSLATAIHLHSTQTKKGLMVLNYLNQ